MDNKDGLFAMRVRVPQIKIFLAGNPSALEKQVNSFNKQLVMEDCIITDIKIRRNDAADIGRFMATVEYMKDVEEDEYDESESSNNCGKSSI